MLSRKEKIRFLAFKTFGNFFVLSALYGVLITFSPIVSQELTFRLNRLQGVRFVVEEQKSLFAQLLGQDVQAKEEEEDEEGIADVDSSESSESELSGLVDQDDKIQTIVPKDTDFGIVITKIGANSRVIKDVDAADYDSYMAALAEGVAHAAGTGLPGQEGNNRNIYLFAHSTDFPWNVGRYNAIFYLLKELDAGDEIDIFYDGKRYIYIVTEKIIVAPDEVSYLTQPTVDEQLVLQTCWPPGTISQRLLIIAKPKSSLTAYSSSLD